MDPQNAFFPPSSARAAGILLAAILMAIPEIGSAEDIAVATPDPAAVNTQPSDVVMSITKQPRRRFRKRLKKAARKLGTNVVRTLAKGLYPAQAAVSVGCDYALMFLPSDHHLPENLRGRDHADFPKAMQWVPRGATAFRWGEPRMILGNQTQSLRDKPLPIGERGSFQISRYPRLPIPFCWLPLYFAFTTRGGTHIRLGARWDDVDDYVQIPSIAIKRKVQ